LTDTHIHAMKPPHNKAYLV